MEPSNLHDKIEKISVFISYSRKDTEVVCQFVELFEARGFKVNLDKTDIAPGEIWRQKLIDLISLSDKVIYFASSSSISSSVCEWEVEQAVERNKVLIPVIISYDIEDKVPRQLADRNFLYARNLDEFKANLENLIGIIKTDIIRVQQHTRFGALAELWVKEGRNSTSGKLLRKEDLLEAELYLSNASNSEPYSTSNQVEFITASRNLAADELKIDQDKINRTLKLQRRTKHYLSAFALVLGIVAIFLAMYDRSVSKSEAVLYHSRAIESLKAGYAEDTARYALSFIASGHQLPWRYHSRDLVKTLAAAALTLVDKKIASVWFGPQYELNVSYSSLGDYVIAGNYHYLHQNAYEKTPLFSIFNRGDLTRKVDFYGSMRTFLKIGASSDAKTVFSFGGSNTLDVWNAITGVEQFRMSGHSDKIIDAVFVNDSLLRSVSKDGTVKDWDVSSGKEVRSVAIGDVQGAAFSSDGVRLVAASYESVSVWDLKSEKELLTDKNDMEDFKNIIFSSDGTRFIVSYFNKHPKLFDAGTGKIIQELEGNTAIFDIATKRVLCLDGSKVYRYFYDGNGVKYADSKEGDVSEATFTSDGTRLLTLSKSGVIELWDQRGALIGNIRSPSGKIRDFDINSRNEIVFSQSDGHLTTTLINEDNIPEMFRSQTYFRKAQFSSISDSLLMVTKSGDVIIREKDSKNVLKKVTNVGDGDSNDVSFAHNDRQLIVSQNDGLSVFSIDDGSYKKLFDVDETNKSEFDFGYYKNIQFSSDRKFFASFRRIFKSSDLSAPVKIKGIVFRVDKFSKDDRYLITHSRYRAAQVWDVTTGNLIKEIDTGIMEKIGNVDISDDGASIAISIGRTVQVWSLLTGNKITQGSDYIFPVQWVTFVSDGSAIMAGGRDGIIRILSSMTGKEMITMKGHRGAVSYISRSKNKDIALSRGEDNTIQVWNVHNGDKLIAVEGYENIYAGFTAHESDMAGFNHDGNFIFKVQGNGSVVVKKVSLLNEDDAGHIVEVVCSELLTKISRKYSDRQLEDPIITDRNFNEIKTGDVCQKR